MTIHHAGGEGEFVQAAGGVDDFVEELSDANGAGNARTVLLQIEVGSAEGAVGKGIADGPVAGEVGGEARCGNEQQGKEANAFHGFLRGETTTELARNDCEII